MHRGGAGGGGDKNKTFFTKMYGPVNRFTNEISLADLIFNSLNIINKTSR